jgi:hypothetical protein
MVLTSLPDIPALTPLERIGPKGFLQYIFPFQLPDDYDIEEVSRVLKVGYHEASKRLPVSKQFPKLSFNLVKLLLHYTFMIPISCRYSGSSVALLNLT